MKEELVDTLVQESVMEVERVGRPIPLAQYAAFLNHVIDELKIRKEAAEFDAENAQRQTFEEAAQSTVEQYTPALQRLADGE